MKQYLADSTFGLDGRIRAILSILASREPSWAEFNEGAQMFEVSFRTGVYYEEGLDPQVWLAMFPSMVPRGPCTILILGVDMSGQIKVEPWGAVEDFQERRAPDPEWRSRGVLIFFKEILQTADYIETAFREHYATQRNPQVRKPRMSLVD
jgi:hypothetical protein